MGLFVCCLGKCAVFVGEGVCAPLYSCVLLQVWDIREKASSARTINQGRVDSDSTAIQDLVPTPDGRYLFTTGGTGVLAWDTRK